MPRIALAISFALLLPALLTACGGGCPEVKRIDASSDQPALVQILFSVQCKHEPVTTITADDVTLYEGGAEVSRSEAQWAFTPHSAALEPYTLLLIDVSDSIIDGGTLVTAREVATEFVQTLIERNQQVSVAIFDGSVDIRTVVDFTDDLTELMDAIDSIDSDDQLDGSTNLNGAVLQGLEILDAIVTPDVEAELLSIASLAIFTDGTDRAGRETDAAARNAVNASDHQIFVVGLVGEDDVEDLEELAKDGFFQATDSGDLFDSFEALADSLVAEVSKYYLLSYCSPLRKPSATLKVEVLHEERKDSISFTYPTKDFGAGCSVD